MTTERMLFDAYALANSRQMACKDDIALLAAVMSDLPEAPNIVQLGAGSGTMSLAIYGVRADAFLLTVDRDQVNLDWEALALSNSTGDSSILKHAVICNDSRKAGDNYRAVNIDLLIVDANHDYDNVKADLIAWMLNMKKEGLIFVHDYDGTKAPRQYPGVKEACDEVLGKRPKLKQGWSGVFNARFVKAFADSLNQ